MSITWIPKPARWPLFLAGVIGAGIAVYAAASSDVDSRIGRAMTAHQHVDELTTGKALTDMKTTLDRLAGDVGELHDVCVKRGDCQPRTAAR